MTEQQVTAQAEQVRQLSDEVKEWHRIGDVSCEQMSPAELHAYWVELAARMIAHAEALAAMCDAHGRSEDAAILRRQVDHFWNLDFIGAYETLPEGWGE